MFKDYAACNVMESGSTGRNFQVPIYLNEPRGKLTDFVSFVLKMCVACNVMESGYTERNFQVSIDLNEPQGKLKKWKR